MFDRLVLVGAGRTSGPIVDRLARIAPLTVIDVSAAALDVLSSRSMQPAPPGVKDSEPPAADASLHPIIRRVADGTSRLVLSDLRGDPRSTVGLVVAPGDDRAALETCRLAADLGYAPIVAVVNDRDAGRECEKYRARSLLRAEVIGQLVERSLQESGLGVSAGGVGFGRGEILEFTVLPSSPAIGIPLSRLQAEGWRVAAIYRGKELVLPTGTSTIAADDRVLIVGDPRELPHVAERLRVGLPTFPLLHGPNIVVFLPEGRDGMIETEAEVLTTRTRASRLIRLHPHADSVASRKVIETPLPDGSVRRKQFDAAPLDPAASLDQQIETIMSLEPGVVVARARPRNVLDTVLGRGGAEARLCNTVGVPALFARGSSHYERIVLCVFDGVNNLPAAEIALDLARMLSVPLVIQRAKLPTYLEEAADATEKQLEIILRRARLHSLQPEVQVLEGNPIAQWLAASQSTDLAIIARVRSSRDSFSRPDLALRVARKSKGSVMVSTAREGE